MAIDGGITDFGLPGEPSAPALLITERGDIVLSAQCLNVFKDGVPSRVQLHFRSSPPMIGVRATSRRGLGTSRIRLFAENRAAFVTGGRRVLKRMGFKVDRARAWPARPVDGGLIVDLSVPGELVSAL